MAEDKPNILDQIYIEKAAKVVYKSGQEPDQLRKAIAEKRVYTLQRETLGSTSTVDTDALTEAVFAAVSQ